MAGGAIVCPGHSFAAPAPSHAGLDSVDERTLEAELARRGVTNLLDYSFKANNVSEVDQKTIRTLAALGEVRDKNAKVSNAMKIARVRDLAQGIDQVLPTLKDPADMMMTAGTLKEYGVDPEVDTIENWGPDPITVSQLKPAADAMLKLMSKAATVSQKEMDDAAKLITGANNDPAAARWTKFNTLFNTATYNAAMAQYSAVLGETDPAARQAKAKAGIEALTPFDSADSNVQPRIRLAIGKLKMASGDYAGAKAAFGSLLTDNTISPQPNPFELYDARYFSVVADVLAGDLAAAQKEKPALDQWQAKDFPKLLAELKNDSGRTALNQQQIDANVKGTDTTDRLLQWRIDVLESDLAKDPAAKKKAEDASEAILLKLREDRPELRGRIDAQLVNRMPENKPIDQSTPVTVLQALVRKGLAYLNTPDPKNASGQPDAPKVAEIHKTINRGIESARMLLARKDRTGISPAMREDAVLNLANLEDRLDDKVAAANGYLDYAREFYSANPKRADEALVRAWVLIAQMRKQLPNVPDGFQDLSLRFQPMAIDPPFNHVQLAYGYAYDLYKEGKFKEALKYFRRVSPASAAANNARYMELLTLKGLLGRADEQADHKELVAQLLKAATDVKAFGEHSKNKSEVSEAAEASLDLAHLARVEQKDPNRSVAALNGFEDSVKGLGDEAQLDRRAQAERVAAYLNLGKLDLAVETVKHLMDNAKGEEGIAQVRAVLSQLDKDLAVATASGDVNAQRDIATSEAALTGYLVDWSDPAKQKNPEVSKFYYEYAVWDARTKRVAGDLNTDPVQRKALLEAAVKRYEFLESDPMHALYLKQKRVEDLVASGALEAKDADPSVAAGLAFSEFDLHNYAVAKAQLEPMIANKKFGAPTSADADGTVKDNDLYWQAQYKFLRSYYEVAKGNPADMKTAQSLIKGALIVGGIPDAYTADFESLRKDAVPDFTLGEKAPVATQPSAAAVGSK